MDHLSSHILAQIMSDAKADNNRLLNMDIWDWSQGVALYGIWQYYRQTDDEKSLAYLLRWFDEKLNTMPVRNVNSTAPLLTLCFLYEHTERQEYLDFCLDWGAWILHEMPRTQMGGLQHITIDAENTQQLWADTVFMTVLFLVKLSTISGQKRFLCEAQKQMMLHIRFLADPATGLWFHGWSFLRQDHFADAFWTRGNCWFSIAAVELSNLAPLDIWVQELILDAFRAQMYTLRNLQHECGLWHTLADHPDSYLETSGSAGIAYGMLKGVRLGYLDESFREPALRAAREVLAQIDEHGLVQGVSYGTVVSPSIDYYKQVALRPTGYGQNLTLMLLTELRHWPSLRT